MGDAGGLDPGRDPSLVSTLDTWWLAVLRLM